MIKKVIKQFLKPNHFSSLKYWENRYAKGGNSGDGSYGRLAIYKAGFINKFIELNNIKSATELGCGDGNQLSLINYPNYTGLDISPTIIELCKRRFKEDLTKRFLVYNQDSFALTENIKSDISISLDVIYHIIEENRYLKYLQHLFQLGKKYVIIYSTNFNLKESEHILHRNFVENVENIFSEWKLIMQECNPYPGYGNQESNAQFFVFEKVTNYDR